MIGFQLQPFLGAMNVIGGRHQTFSRFYRHAFILAFDEVENSTTQRIFTSLSEWHFSQGFSDKITLMSKVYVFFLFNAVISEDLNINVLTFSGGSISCMCIP